MGRLTLLALCMTASLYPLAAEPISDYDRHYGLSALHASRKQFLDAVAGLSEAQLKFKASPESWSIAEVAEHLALAESVVFQAVQGALQSPEQPKNPEAQKLDQTIMTTVPQRTTKFKAPEVLQPGGKFKTTAEAVAAFKSARDEHIQYLNTTQDALRQHFAKHPVLGDMDAYQWLLVLAAHTERHVNQIVEVKASPDYPKK